MIQADIIDNYPFPLAVTERFCDEVKARYNVELSQEALDASIAALKDYFIFRISSDKPVGMPSVLVDELWHAYLLFTREYQQFCNEVGHFIHHTPETDKSVYSEAQLIQQEGFRSLLRCYVLACEREALDPFNTDELPLIFALDALLPKQTGKIHDIKWLQEKLETMPIQQLMQNVR